MKNPDEERYAMPPHQKKMLWRELKDMFTLPEGVDEELVKKCALKKMALALASFKKKLFGNYIKKNKESDWDSFPQVKPYWEEFKEYKLSEEAREASKKNAINTALKKYNHHLGLGGYKKAIQKWQKMEQDLMDRGIRPVTWDWPERSKERLSANGITLNQEDGSFVVPLAMEELSQNLVTTIQEAREGTFQLHRENDELTRALKNCEHRGRARDIGVEAANESAQDHEARRLHNRKRVKRRRDADDRRARIQRDLDAKFIAAQDIGFNTPAANIAGITVVLAGNPDPQVQTVVRIAQRALLQINQQNPMPSISRGRGEGEGESQVSRTPRGHPKRQAAPSNNQ
ncbi:transposase [Panicum miliaceum]|uniref:Transposase n=1 Tax=Panicum miliaceum TaxID=4540 RepID=A0A3L6Q6X8_PANMI|nr:transposase [Panicum miliaceum]